MTKKHKIRQAVYTTLGILCVVILLGLAVIFPKYYARFYDNNTLNKVSFTNININTYETSYETFSEKMYALAEAHAKKSPLRAVRMNDSGLNPGKKELTKIANKEWGKLVDYGVINQELKPKLKAKKLTLSERYTIYGEDTLQGISCWKLVYELSDKTVTMYLDEEFHKIFFIRILFTKLSTLEQDTYDSFVSNNFSGDKKVNYKMPLKQQYADFYTWWDSITTYYNLDFYTDKPIDYTPPDTASAPSYGIITFDYKYELLLTNKWSYEDADCIRWDMGIFLEKMIQF